MTLSSRWRDLAPEAVYQPRTSGRLVRMVGLTLEAIGIDVRTGDRCRVERPGGGDVEAVGKSGWESLLSVWLSASPSGSSTSGSRSTA